jgi:aryl-phospho-beta-D-glucosidase BglC (GH1 family)
VAGRDFVCEGMGIPVWMYPGIPDGVAPGPYKCDFFNDTSQFPSVPELPQEGMAAAWQYLANQFAGNPGVIGADLLSEPGWPAPAGAQACADTPTSDDLIGFFHTMTDAIRLEDNDMMVVFEDGTWVNYITRGFTLTANPDIPNSIYSWHYYPDAPGAPGGQQALAEHVARASEWNLPFNIGEFNAFNEAMNGPDSHTDEANWEQDTRDLMAYATANHLSWWLWQWRVGGGGSLIDPATGLEKPLLLAVLQSGI